MEGQAEVAPSSLPQEELMAEMGKGRGVSRGSAGEDCGFCAISLKKIALQGVALVTGSAMTSTISPSRPHV